MACAGARLASGHRTHALTAAAADDDSVTVSPCEAFTSTAAGDGFYAVAATFRAGAADAVAGAAAAVQTVMRHRSCSAPN